MKKLILSLTLMFVAAGNAQAQDVMLMSRYGGVGSYETTATYSFRKMTHDVNLTRNNWDILLEAREDFKADYFETETVTDDRSRIYDLGDNCDPFLINLSKAPPASSRANVVQGHCYLVIGQDSDGSVVATFKVKTHVKSLLTILSDVKVLSKTEIRR